MQDEKIYNKNTLKKDYNLDEKNTRNLFLFIWRNYPQTRVTIGKKNKRYLKISNNLLTEILLLPKVLEILNK